MFSSSPLVTITIIAFFGLVKLYTKYSGFFSFLQLFVTFTCKFSFLSFEKLK